MGEKKFIIVVTCQNQENLIVETVRSALSQDSPAREIIVVDDAFTAGSRKLLKGFSDEIRLVQLDQSQGIAGLEHWSGRSNRELRGVS